MSLLVWPACRGADRRHASGIGHRRPGLALPGATVTLTNTETGWTRAIVTDAEGRYRAPRCSPGIYEIRAELSGFATAVRNRVPLTLGQELTVNMS